MKQDLLTELLLMQSEMDNKIVLTKKYTPSVLDKCRALIHEAVELEDEFNWKWWKTSTVFEKEKAKEEAIDVLHFLLSILLDLGMDSKEIFKKYQDKWKINVKRQDSGY